MRAASRHHSDPTVPHVVIVGGGFGGLTAAQSLANAAVRVTLIDRHNHHLFQPLLYQVATAGLTSADIAAAIRSVLSSQENATVLMDEVTAVDLTAKTVTLAEEAALSYDFLIVAAGARTHYFGHDDWEAHAPGMKSIADAMEIRRRVLLSFEAAERTEDRAEREALLTFAIVGGGPTGVELAGAVAELGRFVLAEDFRHIRPRESHVVLIEAGPRLLPAFSPSLSEEAREELARFGVDVRLNTRVEAIDALGLTLADVRSEPTGSAIDTLHAATIVWAAGVRPAPLAAALGTPLAPDGRVKVLRDCSLPSHPDAFCLGDMAYFVGDDGKALPGLSPVAMQQARFVAATIRGAVDGQKSATFCYLDKGMMATIGRKSAVAEVGRIHVSGAVAWLGWLVVHIFYLIGFRNRFVVLFTWAWSYLTYRRGARVIPDQVSHNRHTGEAPAPSD